MNPTNRNPNPYPAGRWTRLSTLPTNEPDTTSTPPNDEILPPRNPPLEQLLLSIPESQFLAEAGARMEEGALG